MASALKADLIAMTFHGRVTESHTGVRIRRALGRTGYIQLYVPNVFRAHIGKAYVNSHSEVTAVVLVEQEKDGGENTSVLAIPNRRYIDALSRILSECEDLKDAIGEQIGDEVHTTDLTDVFPD
tara:strand:- start:514 stop:885 length:372 start_codon:yes stop_codon:yes gene_type:complete